MSYHNNILLSPPSPVNSTAPTTFVAEAKSLSQYLSRQLESTSTPNDLLAQISLADDVSAMMADMATSISSAIVNKARDTGNVQNGVSWATAPHIKVHWGWSALHRVLLVLAMAFLLVVILSCQRARSSLPGVWKASILGLALPRVDYQSPNRHQSGLIDDMENTAKGLYTRLELNNGRWAFQEKWK